MKQSTIYFSIAVVLLLVLKLFFFSSFRVLGTADSPRYAELSTTLISHQTFALMKDDGTLTYEIFRTPGYPVFLAVLRGFFGFGPSQVVLVQIMISIMTAFIVYKIAGFINPKIKYFSALFVLFDITIIGYSMQIMTETLFTCVVCLFMYTFFIYLKGKEMRWLLLSSFLLALSVYIRPIGYFLVVPMALCYFLSFYKENPKRTIKHTLIFVGAVYALILLWHVRNYIHLGVFRFSSIGDISVGADGLIHSYGREGVETHGMPPWIYYIWQFFYLIFRIMYQTTVFHSNQSLIIECLGFIYLYIWVHVWLLGFCVGALNIKKDIYLRFVLLAIVYFTAAPVFAAMKGAGARFRIPMIPYIAILTSLGWLHLYTFVKDKIGAKQKYE